MSDDDSPTDHHAARRAVPIVGAVIVLNVVLRVVPLPEVDLPSISIPRPLDWVHAVLKLKNWLLPGVIAVIIIGVAIGRSGRERDEQTGER